MAGNDSILRVVNASSSGRDGRKMFYEGHLKFQNSTASHDSALMQSLPPPSTASPLSNEMKMQSVEDDRQEVEKEDKQQVGGLQKLGNIFDNTFDEVKEFLGFGPKCQNGGVLHPTRKICACPKYFEGALCEKRLCLNGGVLEKTNFRPITYECKCPSSKFIEGPHCEFVKCANGATLRKELNSSWWCDCNETPFYKGQFCEQFSTPYVAIAVPVCLILLFFICCVICRMDLCPRSRRAPRGNRNRRNGAPTSDNERGNFDYRRNRNAMAQRATAQTRGMHGQERLLNEALHSAAAHRLGGAQAPQGRRAFAPDVVAPYVIRLDTIPTFNPQMIGGVEPGGSNKPIDPPPSYEQAVQSTAPLPRPPKYTRTNSDSVPPPSRPPPPSSDRDREETPPPQH